MGKLSATQRDFMLTITEDLVCELFKIARADPSKIQCIVKVALFLNLFKLKISDSYKVQSVKSSKV